MDPRPIGVFDSGLGGLTAVRQLRRLMPSEDIIYFGDTARVPYGNRSRETVLKYARQDMRFLRQFDPKAVVIACGTVSSNCLETLQEENDIPVIGVVDPAVRRALQVSRFDRIGLIATRASVSSGSYQKLFETLNPNAKIFAKACPLFVPLVEEGRFHAGDMVIELVAEEYLRELRDLHVDTLVLGCTHYPLLTEIISGAMGGSVALVDAGQESARAIRTLLEEKDALAEERTGETRFFVSDRVADFERMAGAFLQQEIPCCAEQVDIGKY